MTKKFLQNGPDPGPGEMSRPQRLLKEMHGGGSGG